ncbi:MAG: hypothetical protein IT223_01800, partial [Crocinitomicaceae bacterium]|nr:hypothetical protein [Crocinitomicaceae bacterium]
HVKVNTRELRVYDGDRLVAASFFDVGKKSVASIIGIYDQEYSTFSLGHYTMMKEMEWAERHHLYWYYPGYIMDVPSSFDYKLRLGTPQWLNAEKKWVPWGTYDSRLSKADFLRAKMGQLGEYLTSKGVTYKEKLYPYFTTGHIVDARDELLKSPIFLDIEDSGHRYAATYDIQKNVFLMSQVEVTDEYNAFLDLEVSQDYKNDETYEMSVLRVHSVMPLFISDE